MNTKQRNQLLEEPDHNRNQHQPKEKFESSFNEAVFRYKELRNKEITLRFNKEWFFTMRAGIRISSMFSKKRIYFMNVNLYGRSDVLSKLSKDDLIGRFGHELAHIIDYERMSNFELAMFALKYLFNKRFRFSVEKRINAFAANNGFAKELFGVWEKFCSMENISPKYKEYIKKNYRPDWEDIQEVAKSLGINMEKYRNI